DSYSILRNGDVLATNVTANNYDDLNVYPGTYTYVVRAHYNDLGYSPASNEASETVPGGINRNLVVLEIGTGTWCQYCPGAAMGADDLVENGHNVAVIEYHDGDNYVVTDATNRLNYYSVSYFPTAHFDGTIVHEGGNATTSLYNTYLPSYNERIVVPAVFDVTLDVTETAPESYSATVTVEETYSYFSSGLVLHAVLTESHIPEAWQNQTELNFVCRAMYPGSNGTALDFSGQTTQTETFDFTLDPSYVKDNCEFIVFVQHNPTKEIIQAEKVNLGNLVVINEPESQVTTIYPNPANDLLKVYAEGIREIIITGVTGQIVYHSAASGNYHQIDVSSLAAGLYAITVTTEKGISNRKALIK
ncbi:MAG: Omp28-related outer membrane protein, partial [Bacteroidetes bacterium]|nr:Omp28-related outer membrane protein [Bacteroidota bacterium]